MLIKLFKKITQHQYFSAVVLALIFLIAAYLRLVNLNWDQSLALHPDERNIALAVSRLNWPEQTNPAFYAYNGFPLFLADLSSQLMSNLTNDVSWQNDLGKINLITRTYSAIFSLISVIFFYLIAKKIFSKNTVLIVTWLAATTVTLIQHAHFGVTESLLVLELLMLTWLSICFIQEKKQRFLLAQALVLGLSLATKTSALPFAIIPALSIWLVNKFNFKALRQMSAVVVVSFLVFYLTSPHTFHYFQQFLSTMRYEQAIASGQQKIFYTMQFIGTIPYLFQLKTLLWQTSPLFLLIAGGGLYWFFKNFKKYRVLWPLILFSIIYFLYIGSWYAKFNRYLMPVIPALILLAGVAIEQFPQKRPQKILISLMVITHGLWALAFIHIYQTEDVRLTASHWIEDNIASDSVLLHEERDVRLPVVFSQGKNYQYSLLELYPVDSQEKINNLSQQLSSGDYLLIASQRLYRTIPKSADHPDTKNYYQLLFAGELGYQKITEFSSYPKLLGLEINDERAEETFTVFDHPHIFIFKNVDHLSQEELFKKIRP
ncbi:glycosyltransferase family 39 protein [Candidatus Woesebacteria bacterium]|nr:glycosyltransferase family 39 protein [Candidatus Woesebacteria bacterium]